MCIATLAFASAGLLHPHVPFDEAANLTLGIAASHHARDKLAVLLFGIAVLFRAKRDNRKKVFDHNRVISVAAVQKHLHGSAASDVYPAHAWHQGLKLTWALIVGRSVLVSAADFASAHQMLWKNWPMG